MFSINTNITSLQAQNYLGKSSTFQAQTINQVTSGLRIVNSGDDAAGLAVANGIRSDESVLTQGIQNANNGLATMQTIDSGMNNISTLLDRARTLATESASGTFTGNRATLNSEFQSVMGEVNRQATSIGMNQGGAFAKNLSVFIGGGQGATNAAISTNGSIGLDLSKSAVDTQSLGLSGVQSVNSNTYDLGSASATSVAKIVTDAINLGSETTANTTQFTFHGAGFSNSSTTATPNDAGITINVNTLGVADTDSLVTQINSAIQTAGNGVTGAAAAFKAAGITASIVTDSSGNQKLAFNSSNSGFDVQAADKMSSALLGNFAAVGAGGNATTGAVMGTVLTGAANLALANLDFSSQTTTLTLSGAGLSSPVQIKLTAVDTGAGALATDINTQLTAAGITAGATGILVAAVAGAGLSFTSAIGAISLTVSGDTGNKLGMNEAGGAAGIVASGTTMYNTFNSNGASQLGTSGTASDLSWGTKASVAGASQSLTVSANDASGKAHQVTINLATTAGTAVNTDSLWNVTNAVAAINQTLQQSNDSTMQQISAIAVNDNKGVSRINFVSNLNNFAVAVGNATGTTGTTAVTTQGLYTTNANNATVQGFNTKATQVGSGGTGDISTASGALAAVSAISAAVQSLGTAQAAVGKGENLLNYGVSLAQSQVTNEASAESIIRDANLAQQAANLTKAQILVQAGTAALAQANSAPQQLLSLLK